MAAVAKTPSVATVLSVLAVTFSQLSAQQGPPMGWGHPSQVARWQDSLVQVAINSTDRSARLVAIIDLSAPGATWDADGDPPTGWVKYPGIVARLRQIYPFATATGREGIVRMLRIQAERAEAVAFLSELVLDGSFGSNHNLMGEAAVEALSEMGPRGSAELQRRHASGEGPELVQRALTALARTGYRKPPGG